MDGDDDPRQKVFVLPDGVSYPGMTIDRRTGVHVLSTRTGELPKGLEPPPPHTWAAHVQRHLNHEPIPRGTGAEPKLKPYQQWPAEAIAEAHADGLPGYVLAYPTGAGKTFITVAAINRVAPQRVLVVAPLSHCRSWRSVITRHATARTEWVVINPDRLHHLFGLHPSAAVPLYKFGADRVDVAIRAGIALTTFDIVVTDEAQMLATAAAQRTRLWRRLIGWPKDDQDSVVPASFTINLSATAWTNPSETSAAAHLLATALNVKCPALSQVEVDYDGWLQDHLQLRGYERDGRWHWADNHHDVLRLTGLLYDTAMGATATRADLGLPKQSRRLHLIELSPDEQRTYDLLWSEFRAFYERHATEAAIANPMSAREIHLRKIQQAALIKVPHVAELVVDALVDGYQVIVPAWLKGTVHALRAAINDSAQRRLGPTTSGLGWAVALTGDTPADNRATVIGSFQSGLCPVIITSVVESISLHAGSRDGGLGSLPVTSDPRITIFGDIIFGGKRPYQAEGRGTREGVEAPAVYCAAAGTVEATALAHTFRKLSNTRALTTSGTSRESLYSDADIQSFEAMADELDATVQKKHAG